MKEVDVMLFRKGNETYGLAIEHVAGVISHRTAKQEAPAGRKEKLLILGSARRSLGDILGENKNSRYTLLISSARGQGKAGIEEVILITQLYIEDRAQDPKELRLWHLQVTTSS